MYKTLGTDIQILQLASWLVHILCDFKATRQNLVTKLSLEAACNLIYKNRNDIKKLQCLLNTPFHYNLGNYIYFLLYNLLSQN